ncbi:FtsB family cell division protein [Mycobacterium sp. SMC-4]|uniref:FtsB family cell division protein n=1 Tax=Mycobacterium sp. SMC-4 TaxID=2857059 RepID=UPI003CFC29B6
MPEAKRPDPRRRTPASRPARPGKSGDAGRAKPRGTSLRRETRSVEPGKELATLDGDTDGGKAGSIRESILISAEAAAEQRFGSTARKAAILAAVVCVLTLTIAGPVRTYFSQRTEMKQLEASEAQLRAQIAELEEQKAKLADPVFIAAQARERLGFVMPGEIPYQVQLPPNATSSAAPEGELTEVRTGDPWYTALWNTISDVPRPISPATPVPGPAAPPPPPDAPAPGG